MLNKIRAIMPSNVYILMIYVFKFPITADILPELPYAVALKACVLLMF